MRFNQKDVEVRVVKKGIKHQEIIFKFPNIAMAKRNAIYQECKLAYSRCPNTKVIVRH